MSENTKKDQEKNKAPFQAGEKGFAVFWLIFGAFFFWQSMKLLEKNPGISSAAAVPLFCSGAIIVCSIVIWFMDRKASTPNTGKPLGTQVKQTLKNLFSVDITVMILLMLLYCVGLYCKMGFYVCTPVFLWVAMTWFMRNKYMDGGFQRARFLKAAVNNLIWTGICILFILVMFTYLFKVVLP